MRTLLAPLLAALVAGCSAIDYYWQGVAGQIDLLRRAQPVDEVLARSDDPPLRSRLAVARDARAFASRELALPANGSYTRYADLGRPFVAWNVFAAPPLSLEPREWCFPVAGCVKYRGYFDEREAKAEAEALRSAGDDVYVAGIPAYSTLGWFDDPLLSSFVRYPETELVRLIFHELAHQVVYVKDDSVFNESFAVAVEEEGVRRWIGSRPPEQAARLAAESANAGRQREHFHELAAATRERLRAIYASDASDAEKRRGKEQAFTAMRESYERLKAGEPGLAGYERWFAGYARGGPNNAALAAVSLYSERVPAFRTLLARCGGDMPSFYARVKELAELPKDRRDVVLAALPPSASAEASLQSFSRAGALDGPPR